MLKSRQKETLTATDFKKKINGGWIILNGTLEIMDE